MKIIVFFSLLSLQLLAQNRNKGTFLMPVNANDTVKHRNFLDENGNKVGLWQYYSQEGYLSLVVNFQNNKRQGEYVRYQTNTHLIFEKGSYLNGYKHGNYERYYSDGSIRVKGVYKNGEKVGEWMYFHKESGTIRMKGFYVNGKKHGKWVLLDQAQIVKQAVLYENGLLVNN
jgi:antitoxin component YwqK of YwqJK toxin-antitoxin module